MLAKAQAMEQTMEQGVAAAGAGGVLVVLGVDPGIALAAALGAVGLLAFDTGISARQMIPAVLLGFSVGTYGAVPVTQYLAYKMGAETTDWKYITAVFLGVCGYFLLAGAVKLARRWSTKPSLKELP